MKVRKSVTGDISKSLEIARNLKEWFTENALRKMMVNFEKNLVIAFDKEVIGFLNYEISNKIIRILWMGVDRKYRRKGVGGKLMTEINRIAEKNNVKKIVVNTLCYKDDYEPYKSTRNFYLKNGFVYSRILHRRESEDEQVEMEKIL